VYALQLQHAKGAAKQCELKQCELAPHPSHGPSAVARHSAGALQSQDPQQAAIMTRLEIRRALLAMWHASLRGVA